MYRFSLSVRAYHTGCRYGLPHWKDWNALSANEMQTACIKAAESVLANRRSKKTAIELFRAGGLGVYNIALIMCGEGVTVEQVRMVCDRIDSKLHDSLN
jgi:hypothetical protein